MIYYCGLGIFGNLLADLCFHSMIFFSSISGISTLASLDDANEME